MGPAGLYAARCLEERGVEVALFEARDRVGGKLLTISGPNGLCYDAGGEWIDADHTRILALAAELGMVALQTPRWPGLICYRGETCHEDDIWPDALEDEVRFESAARQLVESMDPIPWKNVELADFDERTLDDFIREMAHSERGRWWLTAKYRSDEAEDPSRIGLLGWLVGYRNYIAREPDAASAYRIGGGMGTLFEALAATLKTSIHTEQSVQRIIQMGDRAVLQFGDGEATVDRVILALPPPALERIVFDPPLCPQTRCAIEACGMSRGIKICLEFDRHFWHDEDWNGSLICDMPIQQCWDGTKGERPVLNFYIGGEETQFWINHPKPAAEALRQLAEIFPSAADHFVEGLLFDWVGDTFARGAFSHLAPGYVMKHMQHISKPNGLIHFAGEHTAMWVGFIEGALESGERAAAEVIDAADHL